MVCDDEYLPRTRIKVDYKVPSILNLSLNKVLITFITCVDNNSNTLLRRF